MPVYRSENETFYVQCFYRDAKGSKRHKVKRGFESEFEALTWEAEFLASREGTMDMSFADFFEVYATEVKPRIRLHTWISKEYMIKDKILPYFGKMRMSGIKAIDIVRWQNQLMQSSDRKGKPYAPTYLRTLNNQVNAIFNHAERYYGLNPNPVKSVEKMGSKKTSAMQFWTKEEYLRFSEALMDKPLAFHAFELLYWTGIRCGEMLALTPADFDFEACELSITKSYQRLKGVDTITAPKTEKSVRTVVMPRFLSEEMEEFLDLRDELEEHDRIFSVTKSYIEHEMIRGVKASGVKKIRVHDLRHSHVSLLIDMGFSALAIADRVGHEAVDITYRYAHLFPSKQNEMADALDDLKGGVDA